MTTEMRELDRIELEDRVKRMYAEVALEPEHDFHFETGRLLAERRRDQPLARQARRIRAAARALRPGGGLPSPTS